MQSGYARGVSVASRYADFSFAATIVCGDICVNLELQGQFIGPLDTMIAAHALSLDVPFVTNNTREFERVRELRIEDWTK